MDKREKYMVDLKMVEEFVHKNMHIHTDWTGSYAESITKCEDLDEFVEKLWNDIKNKED